MIAPALIAASFAACATAGLWAIRLIGAPSRPSGARALPPAALLSPASADETVRHGEHFAIAARALPAPLFHAAALSGGGIDRARG